MRKAFFLLGLLRHGSLLVVLCSVLSLSAVRAETVLHVTDMPGLQAALASAQGGEIILLAAGDYGNLDLMAQTPFDITFPSVVTIASADPTRPARFSGLDLRGVANLTFDGILFDYTYRIGDKLTTRPFQIWKDSNAITIRNSVFDGDVATELSPESDGYGTGFGLAVRGSSNITVENNEIFGFYRGLTVGWGTDVIVRSNDIHSIRMDGMNFSQGTNILIEDNYIHDFRRSPSRRDHADMIQFWTNGTKKPSTNITIRGNVLMSGDGGSTQSIFMRNDMVDRGLAGEEFFYRNIVIEENVIVNGHTNAIKLGEADGVIIRANTVLRNPLAAAGEGRQMTVRVPKITVATASRNVLIEDNMAATYPLARSGWIVQGNMKVQDISPMQPGYYHKLFAAAINGDPHDLASFAIVPGSPADIPGLGAPLLRPGADRERYRPAGAN